MKFGHHLKTSLYSEWTSNYLAYDELKNELKTRTRNNQWLEEDEISFCELLESELSKVYTFQADKSLEINRRIQNCEKEINDLKDSATTTEEDFIALEDELSLIIADVHDLAKFTRLNYTGFLKIIKKHDVSEGKRLIKVFSLFTYFPPLFFFCFVLFCFFRNKPNGFSSLSSWFG